MVVIWDGHQLMSYATIFAKQLANAQKVKLSGHCNQVLVYILLKVNDIRGASKTVSVTEVKARHILLKSSPIMNDEQAYAKLQKNFRRYS